MARPLELLTNQEVVNYQKQKEAAVKDPKLIGELANLQGQINVIESKLLRQGSTCTVKKLDDMQSHLNRVNPIELKKLLNNNFYDPVVMNEILCTLNSLYYLQPTHPGAVKSNERIKHWLNHLKQIGSESAFGYAFSSNFGNAKNSVVIKAPQRNTTDLLHETIVGIQLNVLRKFVPNFAYVFGGFKCTPPILNNPEHLIGSQDRTPVSWCDISNNFVVDYILYENIAPATSFEDFCKNCTFTQFLNEYLQIIFAELVAQDTIDFQHGDAHAQNILLRQLSSPVSIPYVNEKGVVEYLFTDKIATFIDYGMSHIQLPTGEHLGITGGIPAGVFPDRIIKLFDLYKLLMFCLFAMKQNKNFNCYRAAEKLFRFFSQENMDQSVDFQRQFYYELPDNPRTQVAGIPDFLDYIRRNVPEYSQVMSAKPRTQRILGCTGNDICVSDAQAEFLLGYDTPMKIDTVFDFFDFVSRFEEEGRESDIREVYAAFDLQHALESAYQEYNSAVSIINSYFENRTVDGYSVCNIDCQQTPLIYEEYKAYLIRTAEVNEAFQQASLIYDGLEFVAQRFPDVDIVNIRENYYQIMLMYTEFQMVLDRIKDDYQHMGSENARKYKLPELEVLANL